MRPLRASGPYAALEGLIRPARALITKRIRPFKLYLQGFRGLKGLKGPISPFFALITRLISPLTASAKQALWKLIRPSEAL